MTTKKVTNVKKIKKSNPKKFNSFFVFIQQQIINGKFVPNQKLPSTKELVKMSNLSVATVHKGIAELSAAGMLFSFQGKGVYVSPFFEQLEFNTLRHWLPQKPRTTTLRSDANMPYDIYKFFEKDYKQSDWESFVRIHATQDNKETMAYSINWVNKKLKYKANEFLADDTPTIKKLRNPKYMFKKNVTLATTKSDRSFLSEPNLEFVITTFVFIYENSNVPSFVRMIKYKPKYFISTSLRVR